MVLVGLIVAVVGFILALAVHPTHPGSVNVNTVGWILVVFGLIAFFADLVLWSSWGPGYARRSYVRPGAWLRRESLPLGLPTAARDRGRGRRPAGTALLTRPTYRFAQVQAGTDLRLP